MGSVYVVTVEHGGRLVLPEEVCTRWPLAAGTRVLLVDEEEANGIVLLTRAQAKRRLRAALDGADPLADLLDGRRVEAADDDRPPG
jgi:bifunctional DNA-binding transcriptional regulator/antitoxin component of YhaV-PrlF toxin-antitoxin module